MKIHVAWLLLVATYFFCFGVAVSHDWDWMALEYTSHSMFTDRWFVNTAQIATIGTPFILLVLIGMAICAQGGIGRVAALGVWSHPLSILGYLLGGLILLIVILIILF